MNPEPITLAGVAELHRDTRAIVDVLAVMLEFEDPADEHALDVVDARTDYLLGLIGRLSASLAVLPAAVDMPAHARRRAGRTLAGTLAYALAAADVALQWLGMDPWDRAAVLAVDDFTRPATLCRDHRAGVAHRAAIRRYYRAQSIARHPLMLEAERRRADRRTVAQLAAVVRLQAEALEAADDDGAGKVQARADLVAAARGLEHLRPYVPADPVEVPAAPCARASAPPGAPLIAVHVSSNAPPRLGAGVFRRTPQGVT